MTWLLMMGAASGVWAALNVLCAERQRRVQTVDFHAGARRQASLRESERLAALARKQESAAAAAAATATATTAAKPAPASPRKPAN